MVNTRSQSSQNSQTLAAPLPERSRSARRSPSRSNTLPSNPLPSLIDKQAIRNRLANRPPEQPIEDDYDEDEPLSARSNQSNQSGYQSGCHSDFQEPLTPNLDDDQSLQQDLHQPSLSPEQSSDQSNQQIAPESLPAKRSKLRSVCRLCFVLVVLIPLFAITMSVVLASHIKPITSFLSESIIESMPEIPFIQSIVALLPRRTASDIDANIYRNAPSIIHSIEQHHPQFAHWADNTLHPALKSHFWIDELSRPSRPLVLFLAIKSSNVASQTAECERSHTIVDPLAKQMTRLMYPHSLPSYLLDLSAPSQQPQFNVTQLVDLVDQHASLHSGHGMVYLPDLHCVSNRRHINEKLQRYLDFDNAPHQRLVYLITITMTAKQHDDILHHLHSIVRSSGASISDAEIIREFDRVALASGEDDLSRLRDAELMDPMLARIEQRGTIVDL